LAATWPAAAAPMGAFSVMSITSPAKRSKSCSLRNGRSIPGDDTSSRL
jgi:hypothetical protein